jgi:hypothetical protein
MDKIEVGDRIRFRSITRWSGAAVWRVVNGFWGSTGQRLKPAELAELLKTAARAAGDPTFSPEGRQCAGKRT